MPPKPAIDRNLIFDIGACEGNDTSFYLRKGFRVVAVEANPRLVAQMQARFSAEIEAGALTILDRAAYDTSGDSVRIWHTRDPGHGTVEDNPHRVGEHSVVTTIDWFSLVALAGVPYYCKIDIERSEERFLGAMLRAPGRPTYISAEVHTIGPAALFYAMGYRRFRLINQTYLHLAPLPDPPLEGRFVDDRNNMHGSGLFGRELPGARWVDFGELAGLFDGIQRLDAFPELHRSWYDVHAWSGE
jgi:FkbM family methyltransferase